MSTLSLMLIGFLSQAFAADAGFVGRLANVQGTVRVDGELAKEGAYLKKGVLVTTENGKATVLLGNETVMHLDRNSKLRVSDYETAKRGESGNIDLQEGGTRTLVRNLGNNVVRKNFFIRTKSAVMGVRGTEVMVTSPAQGAPTFNVIRGEALIQLRPPEGAPPSSPIGGPGREFVLHAGQSVTAPQHVQGHSAPQVQVESKDTGAQQKQANEIAPPPAKVETKQGMDAFAASSNPFSVPLNIVPGQGIGLSLDPLANGGHLPVSISVTGGSKY